jgi:hypothetical protein
MFFYITEYIHTYIYPDGNGETGKREIMGRGEEGEGQGQEEGEAGLSNEEGR